MIRTIIDKYEHAKNSTISINYLFYFLVFATPIILYISLVIRYAINVPFWDEWGTVELFKALKEGTLSLYTLWVPHNEHRSILFYVVYLSIIWFSGFNVITPVYFGIAFKFITLFLISDLTRLTLKKYREIAFIVILFLPFFVFAAQEGEVVFWGFASLLFNLGALFTVLLVWGLARYPDKFIGIIIALLSALGGSLISANGVFLWGLGMLFLVFDNLVQKKKFIDSRIICWISVMVIFLSIYFYDYHAVSTDTTLAWILSNKRMVVHYFLAYMSSLTTYGNESRAFLFGALGLFFLAVNAVFLITRKDIKILRDLAPWFLLILYVLMVAIVTTAGRAKFGAWQAQSPRYVIMSYPFWLSLFVLSSVSLKHLITNFSSRENITNLLSLLLPGIIFFFPIAIAYLGAFNNLVPYWHQRFSIGLRSIYEYPYASESALTYIYPDPIAIYPYIEYLDRNNLGPFAPGYRPQKHLLAYSVPLPDDNGYFIELGDKNIWNYHAISIIPDKKNSWEIKSNKAYFTASSLPLPICINDYKYLYIEMAASSTVTPPRVMQIHLKSTPRSDNTTDEYLLVVSFVTGNELNAYSLDLQSYYFPQNTQIESVTIFPFGHDAQLSTQTRSTLTIQKLGFMGMNSPSSCDK